MTRFKPVGTVKKVFVNKIVIEIFNLENLNQNFKGYSYRFKGINDFIQIKRNKFESTIYMITSLYEDKKIMPKNENYKVDNTIYFEAVNLGEFKYDKFTYGINTYPIIGDEVFFVLDSELDCILGCNDDYKLNIGNLVNRQGYVPDISLDEMLSNHISILGNTGSGKSTTVRRLLMEASNFIKEKEEQLDLDKIKFYIFDIHDEYRNLKKEYENLYSVYNIENISIPLEKLRKEDWLNLLTPSVSAQLPILLTSLKLANLMETGKINKDWINTFCAYSLYNNQQTDAVAKRATILGYLRDIKEQNAKLKNILGNFTEYGNFIPKNEIIFNNTLEGILDTEPDIDNKNYEEYLNLLLDKADYKVSSIEMVQKSIDYVISIEESKGNNKVRGYCSSLVNRINQLRSSYKDTLFSNDDDKLGKYEEFIKSDSASFKILNVSESENTELLFITSFILGQIYDVQKEKRKNGEFGMYNIVFDEAHTYICENTNNIYNPIDMFEKIAKEGRKFGIFMLMSSQRPSELSKTVLSQCNNYILHRIRNNLDLEQIRKSIPYVSDNQINRISYLETGVGLMVGEAFPIPYEIKVEGEGENSMSKTVKPSTSWFK